MGKLKFVHYALLAPADRLSVAHSVIERKRG